MFLQLFTTFVEICQFTGRNLLVRMLVLGSPRTIFSAPDLEMFRCDSDCMDISVRIFLEQSMNSANSSR